MYGPRILARYLERPAPPDVSGIRWQYNSRSDRHSKVGCWGVAFDLLNQSALLRRHAADGKIVMGVNHKMVDFGTQRAKKLDLVIARPVGTASTGGRSFKQLVHQHSMVLTGDELNVLRALPDVPLAPVGAVLVALEAKAAMTAHQKALPRLYDELNSSHLCVHGASNQALAIAYVQINAADRFVSSVRNIAGASTTYSKYTLHKQPRAAQLVLDKIGELPRRNGTSGIGFDGVGVTLLDFENDGGAVNTIENWSEFAASQQFDYSDMIMRMAHEYDSRFHSI